MNLSVLQRNAPGSVTESSDEEDLLDEETLEVFDIVSKDLPQRAILPLSRRLGIRQTQVEDIEHRYDPCRRTVSGGLERVWK